MPRGDKRSERDFLSLWRWIAIGTCTALIAFTVVIDNVGRLFLDPAFHVSEILFGALVTSWLVLLGFEGRSVVERVIGNRGDKNADG
jgi:hypothetical protein